ncbi:hypothetical protein MLD38_035560 [Melastoma candidum]|uniref:Uncharacterized protein n=1 Tax=Melastoma candidum TaxID=119954 RepID=A0ACB9LGX0_9MYRT|nr:hypothetical protein MLD38_035560 [Melastoma candidum]
MLGSFVTGTLLLGVGYAYPAFQCYKTLEKNKVGIEELRFWCQYWIIMALVVVVERSADVFISWVPFHGELKLALVVYLWHPRFSGSGHVYDTMLRPFLAKHENDIERSISEMRARGWDMAVFYWQYATEFVQNLFLQGVSRLATQTDRLPRVDTPKDSTGPFGPGKLPTSRSARLSRTSQMNRSMHPASDAGESSPRSQNDFIYVENYEQEENDPCNLGHQGPPTTPNKSDVVAADRDDSGIGRTDSSTATEDGTGPKHRLNLRGIIHRRPAAV